MIQNEEKKEEILKNNPSFSPFAKINKKEKPPFYKVLLLNDDFTPLDFVVHVLNRFFHQSEEEAKKIVLHIHNQGLAEAGIYSYEIAETKVYLVNKYSKKHKFPLKCILEKV